MNVEDLAVLESLLHQMTSSLASIAGDVGLALEVISARRRPAATRSLNGPSIADLVDDGRFAVCWNGRECFLGPTVLYRLFRRLALSKNRYVSHEQLLDDVWDGHNSSDALRSGVCGLRRKLAADGMADLAQAIESRPGHYGLRLDRALT